ncbi:MAG: hypothetical protein OHK0011_04570 [Turneriella sp.]
MLTGRLKFQQQVAGFQPTCNFGCYSHLLPATLHGKQQRKKKNTANHRREFGVIVRSQSMLGIGD